MFKLANLFFMLVETPLHAGSGDDLGVVDLPIQRERPTGYPKVEASGLKGCIREAFRGAAGDKQHLAKLESKFPGLKEIRKDNETEYEYALKLVFGPEEGDLHAGALGFIDARLLLFPVRAARGVFAWITCPAVLHRFVKELKLSGVKDLPSVPTAGTIPEQSGVVISLSDSSKEKGAKKDAVVLEEYTFEVKKDKEVEKLASWLAKKIFEEEKKEEKTEEKTNYWQYWQEKMKTGLVVLEDDDFQDLIQLATEIITRIRIEPETGTVKPGALFNEEYLPQDSILYSLALTSPLFLSKEQDKGIFAGVEKEEKAVLDFWQTGMPGVLQLGGNATIGKGLVRIKLMEEGI